MKIQYDGDGADVTSCGIPKDTIPAAPPGVPCTINFTVEADMSPPVYVYYELDNFYQVRPCSRLQPPPLAGWCRALSRMGSLREREGGGARSMPAAVAVAHFSVAVAVAVAAVLRLFFLAVAAAELCGLSPHPLPPPLLVWVRGCGVAGPLAALRTTAGTSSRGPTHN
jgi:hypothetical protein